MQIVYVCDKKKKCANTLGCGSPEKNNQGIYCNHTLDPNHAKNGVCDNPEESDRFIKHEDYYEEKLQEE